MEIQHFQENQKIVQETKKLSRGVRLIKQKINYPRPISEEGMRVCGRASQRERESEREECPGDFTTQLTNERTNERAGFNQHRSETKPNEQ